MERPDRIKIVKIRQVCIVVKDVRKTAAAFWNILGIGPWQIFPFGSPVVANFMVHGKITYVPCRGAVAECEPMELELLQDVDGRSVYSEWVEEHGESLHHMKFITDDLDVDKSDRYLERLGFPNIQYGYFGAGQVTHLSYHDARKALKCIWETSTRSGGKPYGAGEYPNDPKTISPARVKLNSISEVGIVVKNAAQTAQNYWDIMGIGPWEIRDWASHEFWDRTCRGKPAWGLERTARTSIGEMELELVQPVEGDSVYQNWLDARGESIQHLKFPCNDIDATSQVLTEMGFMSLQSGHFGDPAKKEGGFNIFDVPPLHCIVKLEQKPKVLPVKLSATVPPRK